MASELVKRASLSLKLISFTTYVLNYLEYIESKSFEFPPKQISKQILN